MLDNRLANTVQTPPPSSPTFPALLPHLSTLIAGEFSPFIHLETNHLAIGLVEYLIAKRMGNPHIKIYIHEHSKVEDAPYQHKIHQKKLYINLIKLNQIYL